MKPIPLTECTNWCCRTVEDRKERLKMKAALLVTLIAFAVDAWWLL